MSIMMISSLNTYTQNMKMQMKWEQKRAEGNYSSDGSTSLREKIQPESESESSSIAAMTNNSSHEAIMREIQVKLNAGKQLSSSELEYLKKYDPETYQHAKTVEMERKAYEQRLKSCKTKEEVQMLKASQMATSLDRVRDINNNPNISSGEKLKLTLQEHQKVCSVVDSTKEFTESKEYSQLPTQAEKDKAEKDLKEAKEAELKGTDKKEIEKAEETEEEKASDSDNSMSSENEETKQTNTEKTAETTPTEIEIEKAKRILFSSEKSRIEAELTPEAQKVKRAKAHASYTQYKFTNDSAAILNIKK